MKKKSVSFKGKVKSNVVRQESQRSSFGYLKLPKDLKVYVPIAGSKELIDIIPYPVSSPKHPDLDAELGIAVKGSYWYKRPIRVHRNVGTDKESVICLSSFGEKCPICEYRAQRAKEGADKDELKAYNSSPRELFIVIPKNNKKFEETFHVMDFAHGNFQEKLNQELNEDEDYEAFPDLEDGYTLHVRWKEESFAGNKYTVADRIDFKKRNEDYDESILEDVPALDELLVKIPYEALKAKFFEMEGETDEEEEDEKPVKSKKYTKKQTETEPEEDVLPFNDDDEDFEEKKPIKSKAKLASKTKTKVPELTVEELIDMDALEMADVIDLKGLDIDVEDYETDDELMEAIAEELGLEIPKKAIKKPVSKTVKKQPKPESDDDEKEPPVKSKAKGKVPTGKCPYGHTYGVETDDFDDCDDCPVWSACFDVKEG